MDIDTAAVLANFVAGCAVEAIKASARGATLLARRLSPDRRRQISDPSRLVDDDEMRDAILAGLTTTGSSPEALDGLAMLGESHFSYYLQRLIEWEMAEVPHDLRTSLQQQFLATGRLYIGDDDALLSAAFGALEQAAEIAVGAAQDRTITLGPDATAGVRASVVNTQLAAIERHLALLAQQSLGPSLSDRRHLVVRLREQVEFRHREIVPPDFERQRRVPLDALYVAPSLLPLVNDQTLVADPVEPLSLVSGHLRSVVLGAPGGGKSTLAGWICKRLAEGPAEGNWRLPFLVTVREFAQTFATNPQSIVDHIVESSDYKYQAPLARPFVEHLLSSGQMVVIFDGLDELLDTALRRDIVAAIEAFSNAYPFSPLIVTSRKVGYKQAPLDDKIFDVYLLDEFDVDRVERYAVKWFDLQDQLPRAERVALADSFISESATVEDLRSNPLLLALLCLLYRGHRHIPQNRPDLYENCSQLLLVEWDRHRKIFPDIPLEAHVDDCVQHLAGWMFGDPDRETGVAEADLVDELTSYIAEWMVSDVNVARRAARDFVNYCKGRAWILSETGDDAAGAGIFQFTHRTFLEYFAALDLVRSHTTPDSLASAIEQHLDQQSWNLVSQIAVHRKNRDIRGAADSILLNFIDRPPQALSDAAIDFCCGMLELVAPKPTTVEHISRGALARSVSGMSFLHFRPVNTGYPTVLEARPAGSSDDGGRRYEGTLLRHAAISIGFSGAVRLFNARPENLPAIRRALTEGLAALIDDPKHGPATVTAFLEIFTDEAMDWDQAEFIRAISEAVLPQLDSYIETSSSEDIGSAIELVSSGLLPVDRAVSRYGLKVLFTEYRDRLGDLHLPLALELCLASFDRRAIADGPVYTALDDLAHALASSAPSAVIEIRAEELGSWRTYIDVLVSRLTADVDLSMPLEDRSFSAVALILAIVAEISQAAWGALPRQLYDIPLHGDLAPIGRLWKARLGLTQVKLDRSSFRQMLGIPSSEADRLFDWSAGEFDFVRTGG